MRLTKRRAADDAVDRSLMRLRLVVGLVIIVVSLRSLQSNPDGAAVAGVLGGIVIPLSSLLERIARPLIGPARASAMSVMIDTAVVLMVLGLNGVRPGEPTSLVVVLPLLEAGVRHGVYGMTVTWFGVSAAIVGSTLVDWGGTAAQLEEPIKFAALLLLVALPAAHLSEHLVERVEEYARSRESADHRAELLARVLDASGALVAADPSEVDAALAERTTALVGVPTCIVDADSPPAGMADLVEATIDNDGGAVTALDEHGHSIVALSLGGEPTRTLVCIADRELDDYTIDAIELLCAHARIARHTAMLHLQARLEAEQWAQRARIDPLTGLLNRGGIFEHLEASLAETGRGRVAVAFIDLDRFKQVNDRYGHDAGDELLRETARRLRVALPTAAAGRLGGDEFVIIAPLSATDTLDWLSLSIRAALVGETTLGEGVSAQLDLSLGAAVAEPDEVVTSDQLLQLADERMYADKHARRTARVTEQLPPAAETVHLADTRV